METTVDNAVYSSVAAIFDVALPACLLNAAPPLVGLFQASLLGSWVGPHALGAFGAVSITCTFATRVFNFLVDGVSAKAGKSVGLRAWAQLASRVRMSLLFALAAGAVASTTLGLIVRPINVAVLHLSPEVLEEARLYWWLRVSLVPVLLLNMSVSGILQGFRRVRWAAAISTSQALLEIVGTFVVLGLDVRIGQCAGLFVMGIVTLVTQLVALAAGLYAIFMLPPPEAHGQFNLWEQWFGPAAEPVDADSEFHAAAALQHPLLGGGWIEQHDSAASLDSYDGIKVILAKDTCASNDTPPSLTEGALAGRPPPAVASGSSSPALEASLLRCGSSSEDELRGSAAAGGRREVAPVGHSGALAGQRQPLPGATQDAGVSSTEDSGSDALLDFVGPMANMFVRSLILQTTFFVALVAASRLGTPSLAAHSVVNQLWSVVSFAVDGFAAAGIVLGSRLAAQAHDPSRAPSAQWHLQRLIRRVLFAGFLAGTLAGVVFGVSRDRIIAMFTRDPATVAALTDGTWAVLAAAQPINGLVFVYDGLMYASQSFRFIRNYILVGFAVAFCPLIAAEVFWIKALWGVWVANAAINTFRTAGAAYLIHCIFMREFDAQKTVGSPAPQTEV